LFKESLPVVVTEAAASYYFLFCFSAKNISCKWREGTVEANDLARTRPGDATETIAP